ncbi:MAG: hypothetical protein ACM3JD_05140 [Rudaea sp.]
MTALPLRSSQAFGRLWTEWMLATLAAGIGFLIISIPIDRLFVLLNYGPGGIVGPEYDPLIRAFLPVLALALTGAVLGVAQWLILRRYLPGIGWWVLATAVGYAIPFSGLVENLLPNFGRVTGLLLFLVAGGVIGIGQWLVLRSKLRDAYWWAVLTPLAWALAYGLTRLVLLLQVYVEPMDLFFAFLIPPAVQGLTLVYLLQRASRYA